MEALLGKVTQQAMNYAIRSGIAITSGYAIRQCSRLLKNVEGKEKEELKALQLRLESKIRIISPAIDMIELIAARGNTSLESALALTKELRWEIQSLGVRLAEAATEEELHGRGSSRAKASAQAALELKLIVADIRKLLDRIEDAVPLINLAITTSGASLSTTLPATISPSRLLQASTFLTAGDTQYSMSPSTIVQIGPTFTLSMYMLFAGHIFRSHEEGARETTWKEVMHKARVKLLRVPLAKVFDFPSAEDINREQRSESRTNGNGGDYFERSIPGEVKANEFAYHLLVVEDLDDGRVHTFEEGQAQPGPYEGVELAGLREIIPVHEVSKIFYADTGKILNIGSDSDTNSPVLLLKRDVNAIPPRRMMNRHMSYPESYEEDPDPEQDEQNEADPRSRRENSAPPNRARESAASQFREWRLPANLDFEWIAFEVYTEDTDPDSETELLGDEASSPSTERPSGHRDSLGPTLASALAKVHIASPAPLPSPSSPSLSRSQLIFSPSEARARASSVLFQPPTQPVIRTSLSLLEMLVRLTALQQFQQCSHLAITDELLNFFLEDSSTTGAGADSEHRRRVRRDARQRVGFDPYDESPIKRRGEEYLHQYQGHDYGEGFSGYGTPSYRGSPAPFSNDRQAYRNSVETDPNGPDNPIALLAWGNARRSDSVADDIPSSPSPGYQERSSAERSPGPPRSGSVRSRQIVLRNEPKAAKVRSPLGRGVSVETDSTLGTSPASETVDAGKSKNS